MLTTVENAHFFGAMVRYNRKLWHSMRKLMTLKDLTIITVSKGIKYAYE